MAEEFYTGRRVQVSTAGESTYGTVNSATLWEWPGFVQGWSPKESAELEQLISLDETDAYEITEYVPTVFRYGGTLKTRLQTARLFALAQGADSVTGASPYTHTMDMAATRPSFNLQVFSKRSSSAFGKNYYGCVINAWEVQWNRGKLLDASFEIIAQNAVRTATAKSYNTSNTAIKKYTQTTMPNYQANDTKVVLNGSHWAPYVTQITIKGNNNLYVEPSINEEQLIEEPTPQVPVYEIGITLKAKEYSLWDHWKTGAKLSSSNYIQVYQGSRYIMFSMTDAILENASTPIEAGGGIQIQELAIKVPKLTIAEYTTISSSYLTKAT